VSVFLFTDVRVPQDRRRRDLGSSPKDLANFYGNELTHTDQFFRVDAEVLAPSADSSTWGLAVRDSISIALWRGVHLRDVPQLVSPLRTLPTPSSDVKTATAYIHR